MNVIDYDKCLVCLIFLEKSGSPKRDTILLPLVIKSNQDKFGGKNRYIALTGVNDAKMNTELV